MTWHTRGFKIRARKLVTQSQETNTVEKVPTKNICTFSPRAHKIAAPGSHANGYLSDVLGRRPLALGEPLLEDVG